MDKKQKQKLKKKYITLCAKGRISRKEAAEKIGITQMSVGRLLKKYNKEGNKAFIHHGKGHKPYFRKYDDDFENKIIKIYETEFFGASIKCFKNYLEDYKNIKVKYKWLYNLFNRKNIDTNHGFKKSRIIHNLRAEREHIGELVQFDATPYDFFKDGEKITIHGAVDDATHIPLALYATQNECRLGYNEVLRIIFEKFGVFREAYTDASSCFFANKRKKDLTEEEIFDNKLKSNTQWINMCKKLEIKSIIARSPQAKGRIERFWETLQDQLPHYIAAKKIKNIDELNEYLKEYCDNYKKHYQKEAKSTESYFRKLNPEIDLNYELSLRFPKKTNWKGEFLFHDNVFRIKSQNKACRKFELLLSEKDGIHAYYDNQLFDVELIEDMNGVLNVNMSQVEQNLIEKYLLSDSRFNNVDVIVA